MDIQKLKGYIPDQVLNQIPDVVEKFNINNELRLAHFLAQCAHESLNFKVIYENLNYSLSALRKIFGKYFPTDELANKYARKPEKIANRVYANRMSNGDEQSGDGWKYRGRGYIQLTGKANYREFSNQIGIDVVEFPDQIATNYPLLSAAWFWGRNNLNNLAKDDSIDSVKIITKRINGGYNGLDDRIKYFRRFYDLLTN